MTRVAVVLSGCGFRDGSEIHESVLTLLSLDKLSVQVQCFAPNMTQRSVINHQNDALMTETRNVMTESARIARGQIQDISLARAEDFDAVIFPGGFGAATNLSTFALADKAYEVQKEVLIFAKNMAALKKPAGFICIAPNLIPAIYGPNVKLTIGHDKETAARLEHLGCQHVDCDVEDVVVDEVHRVVTTPAYMLGPSISKVALGIDKLVRAVCSMIIPHAKS